MMRIFVGVVLTIVIVVAALAIYRNYGDSPPPVSRSVMLEQPAADPMPRLEQAIEPPAEFLKVALIQDDIRANLAAIALGDIDRATEYSPPEFIDAAGGVDAFKRGLKQDFDEYRRLGQHVRQVTFPGELRFASSHRRTFVVVPVQVEWAAPEWSASVDGFHLGVLEQGAEHWTYLDGAVIEDHLHLELFPDFPTELWLPEVMVTGN